MAIEFSDGTHPLYRQYTNSRAWNDAGLLQLNRARQYDRILIDTHNTEAGMRALLGGEALGNCRPYGVGTSKLSDYRDADIAEASLMVVKGLHQWQRLGNTWNYKLHVTLGLDGWLWHLYAKYTDATGGIAFTSEVTSGGRATGEDHQGYARVGRGGGRRR